MESFANLQKLPFIQTAPDGNSKEGRYRFTPPIGSLHNVIPPSTEVFLRFSRYLL
ncbi:hypothetical protein C1A50_3256 [Paenibacillus polymyxa]|nr:hypothetical protein C1A50_3256 [Paenibacillus polymyxa]